MEEYAETFVLDMGEPVAIVSLVRNYSEAAEAAGHGVRYTGLQPGEKLSEKVFSDAEEHVRSAHSKIWATRSAAPAEDFDLLLADLYEAADEGDSERSKEILRQLVPEYAPPGRAETAINVGALYPDDF